MGGLGSRYQINIEMDKDDVPKKLTKGERFLTPMELIKNLAWDRGEKNVQYSVKDQRWLMDGVIWLECTSSTSSMPFFEQTGNGSVVSQ